MRRNLYVLVSAALFSTLAVTGCTPAVHPQPSTDVNTEQGKPVSLGAWDTVLNGAKLGLNTSKYMVKVDASLVQGPIHSSFSVYGGINLPDKADLGIAEATNYVKFYQQGKAAYFMDNGHWTQTNSLDNLNVYESYFRLIDQAKAQNVPLKQLDKAYVVDEYCDVYQAVIPSALVDKHPAWMPTQINTQTGDTEYTFYVGQKDHYLRRISTVSVAGLPKVGSMEANSDTVLFDIDQDVAKINLPKDLVDQLENSNN